MNCDSLLKEKKKNQEAENREGKVEGGKEKEKTQTTAIIGEMGIKVTCD